MEAAIRLYLDENLSPRIAQQLRRRGIDAVTVRDLEHLGGLELLCFVYEPDDMKNHVEYF